MAVRVRLPAERAAGDVTAVTVSAMRPTTTDATMTTIPAESIPPRYRVGASESRMRAQGFP